MDELDLEFGLLSIPYASDFVEKFANKKRVLEANKKFYDYYDKWDMKSKSRVKFSDCVITYTLYNDLASCDDGAK